MANKRILIVEDDTDLLECLNEFALYYDYVADLATNGAEALLLIEKNKYDFIVSDIDMPQMNGVELLKKIRETDLITPFIMISGGWKYEEKELLDMGVNIFLSKPILNFDFLMTWRKNSAI